MAAGMFVCYDTSLPCDSCLTCRYVHMSEVNTYSIYCVVMCFISLTPICYSRVIKRLRLTPQEQIWRLTMNNTSQRNALPGECVAWKKTPGEGQLQGIVSVNSPHGVPSPTYYQYLFWKPFPYGVCPCTESPSYSSGKPISSFVLVIHILSSSLSSSIIDMLRSIMNVYQPLTIFSNAYEQNAYKRSPLNSETCAYKRLCAQKHASTVCHGCLIWVL